MSENILFESEGTVRAELSDRQNVFGKKVSLYRLPTSLSDASVERYLGILMDTFEPFSEQQTSFGQPLGRVQKDAPALRVIDKEQEGHALTFQKWKGVVKSISEDTFVAQLIDLLRNIPEEEAEFFCSDIQDDDKELLFVGAVFYWCIGHVFSPSGQLTRASFLRFQRLPLYSQGSLKLSIQKAKNIQDDITWI